MSLSKSDLSHLLEVAKSAATAAGEYIQSQFDSEHLQQRKLGGDSAASQVVTEVDFNAQEIILDQLKDSIEANDFGLLSEELKDDQSRLQKEYFWCIDPLDGTLPYSEHRTGYAVSIALISKVGTPVIGVVYVPDLRQCFAAYTGSGVFLNDQPFVRTQGDEILHFYMDRSFLSMPDYSTIKRRFEQRVEGSTHIEFHSDYGGVRNAIGVIESCKACYFKFPKPADGCGSIWDYAATHLLMQELELPVSNAQGERLDLNYAESTFMNRQGILYATDQDLQRIIVELNESISS